MVENNFLPGRLWCHYTIIIYKVSVADGLLYTPCVAVTFHWAPSAAAEYTIAGDGPGRVRTYDGDVGLIARPDEPTSLYAEEQGGVMAHQCYEAFYGEHSLVDQFEHGG